MAAVSDEKYRQQALDLAQEPLPSGRTLRLAVISDSMAPFLQPGDRILVGQVAASELQQGDLVVVRRGGELLTHRIIGRAGSCWLTKGDNRRVIDPPVSAADLLGRVVAIEGAAGPINLATGRGRRVNGWLGRLSWWEARLYRVARRLAGRTPAAARISALVARPVAALRGRLYRFSDRL